MRVVGHHFLHNALGIMLLTALAHNRWERGRAGWNALAAFLVSGACTGIAGYFSSLRSADDALQLLVGSSSNQELEEIPYQELKKCIPESLESLLRFPKTFGIQRLRKGGQLREAPNEALLRVFVRRFIGMPFDHLLKSYASGIGSSMVFLLDDPRHDNSAFSRFKLFHELAHVTGNGVATLGKRYRVVLIAVASMSIGIVLGKFSAETIFGGLLILCSALVTFGTFELECESKADALALTMITPTERDRVLYLCRKDWARAPRKETNAAERLRKVGFDYRLAKLSVNVESLKTRGRLVYGFNWNNGNGLSWVVMILGSILLGVGMRPLTRFEALIVSGISIFVVSVPGAWLHHLATGAERGLEWVVREYSRKAPAQRLTLEQLFATPSPHPGIKQRRH